jgi:hypothetical protein
MRNPRDQKRGTMSEKKPDGINMDEWRIQQLESQVQALQGRIEWALRYLDECENGLGTPSTLRIRTLLSPSPNTTEDREEGAE